MEDHVPFAIPSPALSAQYQLECPPHTRLHSSTHSATACTIFLHSPLHTPLRCAVDCESSASLFATDETIRGEAGSEESSVGVECVGWRLVVESATVVGSDGLLCMVLRKVAVVHEEE
jgi:hypothetical protein